MTIARSSEYLANLLRQLCALPKETEWLEFKVDFANPDEIGEYISALSNAAVLANKPCGYLVWGVDDDTHKVVGTTFSPDMKGAGNEQLENWLLRLLSPRIAMRFHELTVDGSRVVILEIGRAFDRPVRFHGEEFIRIGSYKQKLAAFPEKERALWRAFDTSSFEDGVAADNLSADEVLQLLDYPAYFDLANQPLPPTRDGVLDCLQRDKLIKTGADGRWCVTNLGAILFAKLLDDFETVRRKASRVILYRGNSRVETIREQVGGRGYASGFDGLINFVSERVPSNEEMTRTLRRTVPMYPELAVRELIVNALIHQDFSATGTGPMIEVFDDRMEITNPGKPLVATERFLDNPPQSRNETLAALMRRMGICEERGSGIDKVVFETEFYQLPAPMFEVVGDATRAVLFAHRSLTGMLREDRVRACYFHACLKYVNREFMTNTTIRTRFGIEPQNLATASRLIREAVESGLVKAYDEGSAPKLRKYVPFWAVTD